MLLEEVLKPGGRGGLLGFGSCFASSVGMRKSSEVLVLVSTVHFGKLRQFLLTFTLYSEFLSIRLSDVIIIC